MKPEKGKTNSNLNFVSFITNPVNVRISLLTFVLLITYFFLFLAKPDYPIFPQSKSINIEFYNDSVDGGNSEINNSMLTDSVFSIDYTLKEGFVRPYVGANIYPKDNKGLDISGYNQLRIKIRGNKTKNIVVYLITKNNIDPELNTRINSLYFSKSIEISNQYKEFILNINDFEIPDWWYDVNNLPPSADYKPDWKNLTHIDITTGLSPTKNEKREFSVSSFIFHRNNTLTIILMFCFQLAVELALFIYFALQHSLFKKTSSVTIKYKAIEIEEKENSYTNVFDFINQNFSDSNLKLETISTKTGVHQRKIADIISSQYNCNVKTYINQIRINEAKRLLKNSKLNINEIAYLVGFSSPNNFNRVFKNLTGLSPSQFLESTD